jgi:hypothetical protein
MKLNYHKWHEIEIPDLPKTGNCRYCKHGEWDHRPDEHGHRPCTDGIYKVEGVNPSHTYIFIPNDFKIDVYPCMEYVPGDNLAFLEWKAQKKKK